MKVGDIIVSKKNRNPWWSKGAQIKTDKRYIIVHSTDLGVGIIDEYGDKMWLFHDKNKTPHIWNSFYTLREERKLKLQKIMKK